MRSKILSTFSPDKAVSGNISMLYLSVVPLIQKCTGWQDRNINEGCSGDFKQSGSKLS